MDNDLAVFKNNLGLLTLKDLNKTRDDLKNLKGELYHKIDLLIIKINMTQDEAEKRKAKINIYY